MAKRKQYDLIGYVYDKYNRFNNFTEEEIIKIPGVTFNSLEDIDRFTASLASFYEFSNSLDDKYQKKTNFSIRITKDNEKVTYRSVIYNNHDLIKIIDSLKEDTVTTPRGVRTVKMYLGDNNLFMDALAEVLKKIINSKVNEEDREWLFSVFGEKSSYTSLINRYIKGDPFDSETDKILLDLEQGFREYEVFRKYLTNKDKVNIKSDKLNNELDKTRNKSTVSNVNVLSSNVPVKTSLGVIEDKLGSDISYVSLDDEEDVYDPDEYLILSPEELEQMTAGPGNTFKGQNTKYSAGIGRKH